MNKRPSYSTGTRIIALVLAVLLFLGVFTYAVGSIF